METTVLPRRFIEEERPSRIRIKTLDGNQVVLEVGRERSDL